MPGFLFIAGSVLIPLGFGLVPGFLSRRVPIPWRWGLWLGLAILSGSFLWLMRGGQPPFPHLAFAAFGLSAMLSLTLLIVETGRASRQTARRRRC